MKLPDGFEAHIVPRSSTFKHYKVLQANGIGIVDSLYCGEDDQWMFPAYAVEDTLIPFDERICQFRIMPQQQAVVFEEVEHLESVNRGGFGSTGVK